MQKKIKQAQKYLEWGKPNQAIAELKPTLESKQIQQKYKWVPNHMMGIALSLKGEHKTSVAYLEKAVECGSGESETFHMLSVNYYNLGQFGEAEKHGKEAVARKDDFLKAWLNLGSVYRAQAKLDKALKCYEKANQIDPTNAGVAFRIGEIYRDQGDLEQAMKLFDITLKIEENHIRAMLEKADIYKKKGNLEEAIQNLEQAEEIHGDQTSIGVSKAEIYKSRGKYDDAIVLYEELLKKHPDSGALRVNYALCLQEVSRFDQSEKNYRRAIQDMKDPRNAISNYLMGLHYNPRNSKEYIYNEHVRLGKAFTSQNGEGRPVPDDVNPDKRLKVGFVSGGFRRHPVGWMIAGALEQLPDKDFDLYCYTTNNKFDFVTRRIHQNIDTWRSVVGYSSDVIENIIREDELDILVDLSGHSADNCLEVMANEPAPVIVKWVGGLFNTTGLDAFDFLITDKYESPEGEGEYYTEKLVRMPDDYITFAPPAYASNVNPLPAKEKGFITFGCFNNPTKVNDVVLKHWAEIMSQVPESYLYLKSKQYDTASFRAQILEIMGAEGIPEERIEFEGQTSHDDHLAAYNKIDIALDPWPYSGGLTTCEALYMGAPVITMPGPTFAGRHSTTHLMNAGLQQWVTDSWEEYSEKVIALANDLVELQRWRSTLRQKLRKSPVCDNKRFGAHLSVAFREMWKQRIEGYQNEKGRWQDHIKVDALFDKEVQRLTDGPRVTPPITINDTKGFGENGQANDKNVQKDVKKESMIDTAELEQDLIKNGNGQVEENSSRKSHSPSADNGDEDYFIETKDGITICAPADLGVLTTYVLLEQEEWFEPELNFVRDYLQSGMQVVDAGAAFGAYSLPMAKKVGQNGRVFAFEPDPKSCSFLERSKIENNINHLEIVGRGLSDKTGKKALKKDEIPEFNTIAEEGDEEVFVTTLNAWWEFAGQPELDLIKIDVNGMESEVLKGAYEVLDQTRPVILASIGEKEGNLSTLRETVRDLNYQLFEYIPGPGVLAKHDFEAEVDPYLMNLIGIPDSRVEEFKENGWIFDESVEVLITDELQWKQVLKSQPWTEDKMDTWEDLAASGNHQAYFEALNLACIAEQIEISDEEPNSRSRKGAMMLAAAQKLIGLFNSSRAGVATAMTYVRVMGQLGKRQQALEMMKQLMETANSGSDISVELPFLPPLPCQDNTCIQTDFSKWMTVRIVEAWIKLKNPTTYMAEEQELGMVEALEDNPERVDTFLLTPNKEKDRKVKKRVDQSIPNKKRTEKRDSNALWFKTALNLIKVNGPKSVRKHNLPNKLIVSLTSYPARFDQLPLTLLSLIQQTVKPDNILLWIAYEDKSELTSDIRLFEDLGVEICFCEDLKSYKKIIPTLKKYPDSYIVTADDDLYYKKNWLEELLSSWDGNNKTIVAHRAHRVKFNGSGDIKPYREWGWEYKKDNKASDYNFPTCGAGALFPPNIFHEDVLEVNQFQKLAPTADDVWLYWMSRLNGAKIKVANNPQPLVEWPLSKQNNLWQENILGGKNDEQIEHLIKSYGLPLDKEKVDKKGGINSSKYWKNRYQQGGNSGSGSYGRLAQFKADTINEFSDEHDVGSFIEFGCGDGNQLKYLNIDDYLGLDVSDKAIEICRNKYQEDQAKEFKKADEYKGETAECALSLDVIFHLVEDEVFESYMEQLFNAAEKYVVIYSSNKESFTPSPHVRHRLFSLWIEQNKEEWKLKDYIPNKYPFNGDNSNTSFSDFYIYEKENVQK